MGIKLQYENTAKVMKPHVHGFSPKENIILHETVSPDYAGWKDVDGIRDYLANKDYGIHGITDAEGHIAWAYGLGRAIFWQAGGLNIAGIGIEQVSRVMLQSPSNSVRRAIWTARTKELRATAKLIACISSAQGIPIQAATWRPAEHKFSPGVVSHYQVSQHFLASQGHTDCKPVHLGGYYPLFEVIFLAKGYAKLGYHF